MVIKDHRRKQPYFIRCQVMPVTMLSAHFILSAITAGLATATSQQQVIHPPISSSYDIPITTREHWMRVAVDSLPNLISPCPFGAFGTIVNHTSRTGLGDLVCIGVNAVRTTGNPTLHGEIAGINNCTSVLTDPNGQYRFSPSEAEDAYKDLALYTTAEPCAMCAVTIRWAGFRECVFGTSILQLMKFGWGSLT
jgi:tRNA(Arg) A34 adenosine deaminase TadA